MSAEHIRSTESGPELSTQEYEQQLEHLRNKVEQASQKETENQSANVEAARTQVERQAEVASRASEIDSKPRSAHHPSKFDKEVAYNETMRSLRRRLKPAGRVFSQVIHAPVIEKTSEVAAKTVFRPSVTLGATVTALLVGGSAYITARHYGFLLSGSEFIFSLLAGGVIGLAVEMLGKLIRRRR